MREHDIRVTQKRRYKVTTDSRHAFPVAENLLDRKFDVKTPNQVWSADVTFIPTRQGWLYLAVVLDLFSRRVIGWSMSGRDQRQLKIRNYLGPQSCRI
jgi:putative transposase